jgi:hypothetical protein
MIDCEEDVRLLSLLRLDEVLRQRVVLARLAKVRSKISKSA